MGGGARSAACARRHLRYTDITTGRRAPPAGTGGGVTTGWLSQTQQGRREVKSTVMPGGTSTSGDVAPRGGETRA